MPKIKRGAGLSGAQKQFNKLVQLVDQERRHLVQWQQAIAVYERRFADEYQPLQRRYDELQTKLVFALDQAHDGRQVGMEDRIGIADVICDVTGQLLAERADDALKQLYKKYSGEDYDAEAGAQEAALSTTLLEQFGVDLERASPLAAAARIATKWRRDALGGQPGPAGEDEQVAASLAAYAARDVPALLAARREIEHLDQVTVNALPDQRLQQYSQVLSEQLAELRDEIENVEIIFKTEYDIAPYPELAPAQLSGDLDDDLRTLEDDLEELEYDLPRLSELRYLQKWIGQRRDRIAERDDELGMADDEFLSTMSEIFRQRR
ncbi:MULTISPECIES: hypothetical protein [unclassified Janthinobacterium]|uniref:hypothetical protein n=1 Tax=unclassified Janthinobacterium TaxID=2610881 RepID=UPI00034C70F3|nr:MULTISPECIES: hypothetical protein [unclassified Janthinobacterium]